MCATKTLISSEWQKECAQNTHNIKLMLVRMYWKRILFTTTLVFVKVRLIPNTDQVLFFYITFNLKEATNVMSPLLINYLVEYFDDQRGILWAVAFGLLICSCLVINMLTQIPQVFLNSRYGMQMRLGLNGLVFNKVTGFC